MIPLLSGFYVRFGETLEPALNRRIHALTTRLLENLLPGVTDLIPGYTTLYVEYDARTLSEARVRGWVEARREGLEPVSDFSPERAAVELPAVYDGEDLPEIAQRTGLSVEDVVAKHAAPRYDVYALGFTPGFAFMGEVDPALRLPRRPSPRARVPAHSVAMANHQTGVYPTPSPGGWNLLGRTLVRLYDPHRDTPFLLEPGDRVRFIPAQGEPPGEFAPLELLPENPTYPFLRVLEPGLLDLVVDEGRFMGGRYGLSRSGPLDARSAGLANALVGNPRGTLLELNLRGGTFEALTKGVVAFAGWGMVPVVNGQELKPFGSFGLEPGDVLSFKTIPHGSRGYLALAGGLESGRFWGSASADVRGKLGRPLEAGDVLGVAEVRTPRPGFSFMPYMAFRDPTVLRLLPGPQASAEALTALYNGTFSVGSADRMGVRLEGPRVPGGDILSEAVPLGAVQVTSQGDPIVLLNDRGTLGGYAKPARLHPADLPKAAQLRPGSKIEFRRG